MKSEHKYDIAIIGAGPGGYVAAIRASQLGARVVVIEKGELGGTCLHRGCIPTKTLLATANLVNSFRKATEFGIETGQPKIDFALIMRRKERIVKQLASGIGQLFKSYGIEVIHGRASTTEYYEKGRIEVLVEKEEREPEKVVADKLIIATGSSPSLLPGISLDGQEVITSDEALELETVPSSLLIVGGGVIGVEFASIFNALGCHVTVIEILPRIIPNEDGEISEELRKYLVKSGIVIKTQARLKQIFSEGGRKKAIVETANGIEEIFAEKILIATGRKPYTGGLDLEKAGIRTDKGRVIVNEKMETNIPGLFAVGDVVGGVLLAHVASQEGIVASENAMGKEARINYEIIPNCIYSVPEVGSVGLSEEKAKEMGYSVVVGKFPFLANAMAAIKGERGGMVKIVADKRTDKVLGVHIIGPQAAELIHVGSMMIKGKFAPKHMERIMYAHPTLSEAIFEAVHDVHGEAIDLRRKQT